MTTVQREKTAREKADEGLELLGVQMHFDTMEAKAAKTRKRQEKPWWAMEDHRSRQKKMKWRGPTSRQVISKEILYPH